MKYFKRISVIATIILTVMCLAKSSEVKAAGVEDLKELWYETHYYPMNPESDEWKKYGLEEAFDILNPPEDLLHSFSTEELAELMMDYPYLWVLTSYEYEKIDYFFSFLEYCDIYNELMSRDDGVLCLLKEYQKSDYNVNLCNEYPYNLWGYNPIGNAEVFGCQFIVYNINHFDKEEYELCYQVMREKTDLYSALNDNNTKKYLSFVKEQATAEEVKERWYNIRHYPLNRWYGEWYKYDMLDILDILNPPLDLLLSMSTEELAKLMPEYPFMGQITTYLNTDGTQAYNTYFTFLEMFCDIFYELLRREDGITCLLQEYRTHQLNVQRLNEWGPVSIEQMWSAELFGYRFIRYYAHHFTENEYKLACQIIEEKKELYSQLDDKLLYYFDLPELEPPTVEKVSKIKTNYLRQVDIQTKEDKLAAALLQVLSKKISLQAVTPDIEDYVKDQPSSNNAAWAEEVKKRWYDTRYYPFKQVNEESYMHDILYTDTLDDMNPPLDLLLSMSTEELAELMQEYPLMGKIAACFDTDGKQDYATFFSFLEAYCDIFYELLRREDGVTCLLQEYRTHEYVETLNEGEYSVSFLEMKQMWLAELFGCQFIRYYAHHFTDNEYALASQIIEDKKELYSKDYRLLNYLDLPEIEPPTGEEESNIRTNYLRPEEIQEKEDKLAAALLQMQSKENSLPTVTPDTEDSNTANHEENNESIVAESDDKAATEVDETATESMGNESRQKVMIVVGAIIGVVCVIGGFVLIRRRRKGK